MRFSCTVSFRWSRAFCIFSNRGKQIFISRPRAAAMKGSTTHTTRARRGLRDRVRITLATVMVTPRMRMRRHITATFCTLVRSLVSRVMREEEENRSMSAKEKEAIFSNSARRRLAPRPWAA